MGKMAGGGGVTRDEMGGGRNGGQGFDARWQDLDLIRQCGTGDY